MMKRLRMWICDFISLEGEDEGESDNEYLIDCEQDEDDISSIIIVSCETIKKNIFFGYLLIWQRQNQSLYNNWFSFSLHSFHLEINPLYKQRKSLPKYA